MSTPAKSINYHRAGSGAPLLLTHGIGERWQYWLPVLPFLTPHFDVVAVDLPGFGSSPAFDGPVTAHAFETALTGLIANLGWERPHVSGISLGGYLALRLGAAEQVASVTAFSPAGLVNAAGTRYARRQLKIMRGFTRAIAPVIDTVAKPRAVRTALVAINSNKGGRIPANVLADDVRNVAFSPGWDATLDMLADTNLDAAGTTSLAHIPVTVAWGSGDKLLRYSKVEKQRLPATVSWPRLPGCGHTPTWDNPELTAQTIIDTAAKATAHA